MGSVQEAAGQAAMGYDIEREKAVILHNRVRFGFTRFSHAVKVSACFLAAFLFLLLPLNIEHTLAQQIAVLDEMYPRRGSPGAEIPILLKGDGFQSLGSLRRVQINDQEISILDSRVVSNQVITALVLIPEQVPIGETEISFLFDNGRLETYFVVTGRREQRISPAINRIDPQEGQVDTEVRLSFEGTRLSELGRVGGVMIGGNEIPVVADNIASDQSIVVFLPPEAPIGETEINIFFENYSFKGLFSITGQEPIGPGAPTLLRLTPREGFVDTDIELLLSGEGFFGLGNLLGLTVAGVDVPILGYAPESDAFMAITIHLPRDLPIGETRITFVFENGRFEENFFVRGEGPGSMEPAIPILRGIDPREGKADTEVELALRGENLSQLGNLIQVNLAGIDLQVLDQRVVSNETILIRVYLPRDAPRGKQTLAFLFENGRFEESFFVNASSFPITAVIAAIVVVAGGSFVLGRRLFRKRRPGIPSKLDFIVRVDHGIQSVEPAKPSPKVGVDLRFEIETDEGEQRVELDGNSIVPGK